MTAETLITTVIYVSDDRKRQKKKLFNFVLYNGNIQLKANYFKT